MVAFAMAGAAIGMDDVHTSPGHAKEIGAQNPPDGTGLEGLIVFDNRNRAAIPSTKKGP